MRRRPLGLRAMAVRRALLALAACGALGLVVGGGSARIAMRLVLVADGRARGFDTAAGAVVGEVTAGGTVAVLLLGAALGVALGAACLVARPFLPLAVWARTALFAVGATAIGTAFVTASARDDFAFVHEAASVVLIVVALACTALPVPYLVDRFGPPPVARVPARIAAPVVAVALAAAVALAFVAVSDALGVMRVVA